MRAKIGRLMWGVALLLAVLAAVRLWPRPPLAQEFGSSTAVYDAEGRLLRLTLANDDKYRLWVPLAAISPQLRQAVMLHEDRWFFWHPGVNPWAVLRGAWRTYAEGDRQGGSTLTMQLARLKWRLNTRTPWGKCKQIVRALQLEASYGKNELFEAYLNLVPYGGNVEGVGAASLIYFGKPADRLTLPEVLTLAVIPQSPARRTPGKELPALRAARDRLFQRWLDHHPLDQALVPQFKAAVRLRSVAELPFHAPHYVDGLLLQRAASVAGPARAELRGTLDLRLQRLVERQIGQFVERESRVGIRNATALLVDWRSMEVKALVGSANYRNAAIDGQVNGTLAKRSPGSTLKPFIYALALDQGLLHAGTMLKDAPTQFGPFAPENFDGAFVGPISAQDALIRSRNVPAVAVAARLQRPNLYQFLKSAGVTRMASEQHYGLALALGGGEATMEELAQLYAMLAADGRWRSLRHLPAATGAAPEEEGVTLLSPEAAFITRMMLRANPRPDLANAAGTGHLPVAWKTGTSWGFHDAWTAGIVGPYVLVVWVGNFDGEANPAFVGLHAAAPLFFRVVDALASERRDELTPRSPANLALQRPPPGVRRVEVCTASGDLPNAACPLRSFTWFIPGKSPIKVSELHRVVPIDTRTGRPACPDAPAQFVRREVYEYWPSDLARLFAQAGVPRRPPPVLPACSGGAQIESGLVPRILSPARGTVYQLKRAGGGEPDSVPLVASADGGVRELFWFAERSYLGQSEPGRGLAWRPPVSGSYQLRVVDSEGRSDRREIRIEWR